MDMSKPPTEVKEQSQAPPELPPKTDNNGTLKKILPFFQSVFCLAILPWGVWVTGQIYGLHATIAQQEEWRKQRERAAIATTTDVELARLKVKDEVLQAINVKLDAMIIKLGDLDVKLSRHEAATSKP